MKIDTAVILAGGKGGRLLPLTLNKPKSMINVIDKPIIDWILLWLKKNKIKNIVISVDYKKKVLINYLGSGKKFGVSVTYNDHRGAEETGDAFRSVLKNIKLPNVFLAMNGDQITDLSIKKVIAQHQKYDPIATIVTCPVRNPYGIVELGEDHSIKSFAEKPIIPDMLMNAGIYVFNKKILPYLPEKGRIEETTFVKLAKNKNLRAYIHNGFFLTVNDRHDLQNTEKILREQRLNLV